MTRYVKLFLISALLPFFLTSCMWIFTTSSNIFEVGAIHVYPNCNNIKDHCVYLIDSKYYICVEEVAFKRRHAWSYFAATPSHGSFGRDEYVALPPLHSFVWCEISEPFAFKLIRNDSFSYDEQNSPFAPMWHDDIQICEGAPNLTDAIRFTAQPIFFAWVSAFGCCGDHSRERMCFPQIRTERSFLNYILFPVGVLDLMVVDIPVSVVSTALSMFVPGYIFIPYALKDVL